jgi:hypothetical protein
MILPLENRYCLLCLKTLKGRADKKFCDDGCRNAYNNQRKAENISIALIRDTNNTLIKNRGILMDLLPSSEQMIRVQHDKLLQKGFVFKYHTHLYTNHKGNTYYFCYDYGYLPLENRWYLIVRRKE